MAEVKVDANKAAKLEEQYGSNLPWCFFAYTPLSGKDLLPADGLTSALRKQTNVSDLQIRQEYYEDDNLVFGVATSKTGFSRTMVDQGIQFKYPIGKSEVEVRTFAVGVGWLDVMRRFNYQIDLSKLDPRQLEEKQTEALHNLAHAVLNPVGLKDAVAQQLLRNDLRASYWANCSAEAMFKKYKMAVPLAKHLGRWVAHRAGADEAQIKKFVGAVQPMEVCVAVGVAVVAVQDAVSAIKVLFESQEAWVHIKASLKGLGSQLQKVEKNTGILLKHLKNPDIGKSLKNVRLLLPVVVRDAEQLLGALCKAEDSITGHILSVEERRQGLKVKATASAIEATIKIFTAALTLDASELTSLEGLLLLTPAGIQLVSSGVNMVCYAKLKTHIAVAGQHLKVVVHARQFMEDYKRDAKSAVASAASIQQGEEESWEVLREEYIIDFDGHAKAIKPLIKRMQELDI